MERNSQRSIVRVTGVSRVTVAKLVKKAQAATPSLLRLRPRKAQRREWEALELDKIWTFVGRRKRKVWLWLAIGRASRHIVAWVIGRCDAATAGRLWQALPGRSRRHCWYFTDLFPAYVGVLPRWQHRRCPKGSGGTSIVEAINCSLRQRWGMLVRKFCSFSKSCMMPALKSQSIITTPP